MSGGRCSRYTMALPVFHLAYQENNSLYSFRALFGNLLIFEGPPVQNQVYEMSILYGKVLTEGKIIKNKDGAYISGFVSASAGISAIKGINKGKLLDVHDSEYSVYEELKFKGIGIPLDMQFFLATPYFGYGVILFANINTNHSFYGFLIGIQIGKLR